MQRSVTVAAGALLLLGVGAVLWKSSGMTKPSSARDAGAEASPALANSAAPEAGTLDDPLMGLLDLGDAGSLTTSAPAGSRSPLPANAPKFVRLGVILVQYRGAEGAPPTSRTRQDAMALAQSLAEAAKSDFKAQVGKGDPGSLDDAGRIPRGVLEPPIEWPVFTLEKGAVSAALDTPRGFWIVKRLE